MYHLACNFGTSNFNIFSTYWQATEPSFMLIFSLYHYVFCFHIYHLPPIQLHGGLLVICIHTFNAFALKRLNDAH